MNTHELPSEGLTHSDAGQVNKLLHSYAIIFARRMKEGDEFKPESDRRRLVTAEKIVETLRRYQPEQRIQVANDLMHEVHRQWNESIVDGMRQFKVDDTSDRAKQVAINAFDRLNALVQALLVNQVDALQQAQQTVEDGRAGKHHQLIDGAGI